MRRRSSSAARWSGGDISVTNPAGHRHLRRCEPSAAPRTRCRSRPSNIHKGRHGAPTSPTSTPAPTPQYATTAYTGVRRHAHQRVHPARKRTRSSPAGRSTASCTSRRRTNVSLHRQYGDQRGDRRPRNNVTYDPTRNSISFGGNVYGQPDQHHGASASPAGEETLTGRVPARPPASPRPSPAGFGTVGGHIIASGITFSGNSGGTIQGRRDQPGRRRDGTSTAAPTS